MLAPSLKPTPERMGTMTILLAVSAVMLLFILLLMGIPLIGIALLKLGLVAALFPAARDYIARNRPRTFAPDAPPADLLP